MRPITAVSTVLPGWTRLWLSLTVLLSPLSIAAAILGNWDPDASRIAVAAAFLALAALFLFILLLPLRLHLALLGWINAGFDLDTRQAIRRHLLPLFRAVLMLLVLGFCLFWLQDALHTHEQHGGRGSFCPTAATSA